MPVDNPIVRAIHAELEREASVDLHHYPMHIHWVNGELVLDGEMASVGAKKLALHKARTAAPGVPVVDRMRVKRADHKEDGQIRDEIMSYILQDSNFRDCTLELWVSGRKETIRDPVFSEGCRVELRVDDGVVIMSGEQVSLTHKRLLSALAWWAPGVQEVMNQINVVPPQEDRDDEITDAVRIVLEKDPMVEAAQVRARTHNRVVMLEGLVVNEEERRRAESDVWCLDGVEGVVNTLEIRAS